MIAEPTLTDDVAGRETALLRLEGLASAAVNRFVFDDETQSFRVRSFLYERGVAEFAPPFARLALADDGAVGMYALCPANLLQKRRLGSAMALAREGKDLVPPAVARRLRSAGAAQVRPMPEDAYLGRIAVDPAVAGKGYGAWLLGRVLAEARDAGFRRCVLDVAADNATAVRFYERAGFSEIGRGTADDAESGRRVSQLHLALPL